MSDSNSPTLSNRARGTSPFTDRSAAHTRTLACHLFGESSSSPTPESTTQTTSATPKTLLSLRNGERINQASQARHNPNAWETDDGVDTDTDLMIDRLHDLSD